MALNAAVIVNVRPSGADTNGGGFREGGSGTNWSLQDSAQYSVTDGVTNGTTTITSASANFGTDVVHNLIYIAGGTGSVVGDWYEITARTNSTTITVDRSTGLTSGTGVTLKIGGALQSPGLGANLITVTGIRCYVKGSGGSPDYTLTTSTAGAGGPIDWGNVSGFIEGYGTTQGDRATRPVISAGSITTAVMATVNGSTGVQAIINFTLDCNNQSGVSGVLISSDRRDKAILVEVKNASASSQYGFSGGHCENCKAENCVTGFTSVLDCGYCESEDCTTGFSLQAGGHTTHCLAYGGTTGISLAGTGAMADYCTVSGATTSFIVGSNNGCYIQNCLAVDATTGFSNSGTRISVVLKSYYHNCTTPTSGTWELVEATALSGNPFVDSTTDDYRPDATSGEGLTLRAAGYGHLSQTNNVDVGAVQHTDPAGSAGIMRHPGMSGGLSA